MTEEREPCIPRTQTKDDLISERLTVSHSDAYSFIVYTAHFNVISL